MHIQDKITEVIQIRKSAIFKRKINKLAFTKAKQRLINPTSAYQFIPKVPENIQKRPNIKLSQKKENHNILDFYTFLMVWSHLSK